MNNPLSKFFRVVILVGLLASLPFPAAAEWGGGSWLTMFPWIHPTQASVFNRWLNAFRAQPYAPCGDQVPPIDPRQYRFCPGARSDGSLFGGADINLLCTFLNGKKIGSVDGTCPSNAVNSHKNLGLDCAANQPIVSNPINAGTGNKVQIEIDYAGSSPFPLQLVRTYNSLLGSRLDRAVVGANWSINFGQRVSYWPTMTPNVVHLVRSDGNLIEFRNSGNSWIPDRDVSGQLIRLTDTGGNPTGWGYTGPDETVENYDDKGRLISIKNVQGLIRTLTYDLPVTSGGDDNPDTLDLVTGPFDRTLRFSYDVNRRIETFTDPEGGVYRYTYDAKNHLSTVVYPDHTPGDPNDNPRRIYHYEDTQTDRYGKRLYPNALTGITDENGDRFATWAYDAQGRAFRGEHAGGAERTTLDYTHLHDLKDPRVIVTNALGKNAIYHLGVVQGVIKVTRIEGAASANCVAANQNYTYDASGNLDTITDREGNVTNHDYDARNLEIRRIEAVGTPDQRTIQTQWHANLRLPARIEVFDRDNNPVKRTDLTYDATGRLLNRTETDISTSHSRTTAYTYTAQGLLESIDGPRTDVADLTTFGYDQSGNLIQITNAQGHISRITAHDASGRPLTLVDPNGSVTALAYDARGRLLSHTVDQKTSTFGYDPAGNLTGIGLPNGFSLTHRYNAAHQLDGVSDNLGNLLSYTLDAQGNRIKEDIFDPNGVLTRTRSRVFDELSRLIQQLGGAGQQTDLAYDRNGNLISVIDGRNHATTRAFDALNRRVVSTDPAGGISSTEYDVLDQAVQVTDPKGLTTRYTYNALGDLLRIDSPDTGVTGYLYDEAGNPTQMTDARGEVLSYQYDALNRITAIHYSDPHLDVTFTYDENDVGQNGIGRLTRMVDASGISTYSYDLRGNLLTQTSIRDGVTHSTAYSYNGSEQPAQIIYPSGRTVDYVRDNPGRITSVATTQDGSTRIVIDNLTYEPFGPNSSLNFGNGIGLVRFFDLDYRLTAQTHGIVSDLSYLYDAADNLVVQIDNLSASAGRSYGYDALDRLETAHSGSILREYSYDQNGNRLTHSENGAITHYGYSPDTHHLESLSGADPQSYTYDSGGNTIRKGNLIFGYGDHNRLTTVSLSSGAPVASYGYNGHGERVKKTAGSTTYYHYDNNRRLIAETDAQGNSTREYIYLDDTIVAVIAGGVASSDPPEQILDNSDPGTVVVGRWKASTAVSGFEGSNYQFHAGFGKTIAVRKRANRNVSADTLDPIQAGGRSSNRVTWKPVLTAPDHYNIFAKWTAQPNRATNATYRVRHRNGTASVVVNQQSRGGTWNLLGNFELDGQSTITLIGRANGRVIADAIRILRTGPPPSSNADALYFVHSDHLATPQAITDRNQNVVWSAHATPFGLFTTTGSLTFNLRFPGQYFDRETGLHYNYFRYYDPQTGRYVTSDPIGLQGGLNTYAYVANNPLKWIDPTGLYTEIIVWQPVGWSSSSFGHVSSNVNRTNYSWGPRGWDTKYPNAVDYAKRQQGFRSGVGTILKLTPEQEKKLVECYAKKREDYSTFTNNCGDPHKDCLREATGGALSDSLFPVNIGNDLLDSPYYGGSKFYDGPSTPRGFFDDAFWVR